MLVLPKKENPISSVVIEILSFRQNNRATFCNRIAPASGSSVCENLGKDRKKL